MLLLQLYGCGQLARVISEQQHNSIYSYVVFSCCHLYSYLFHLLYVLKWIVIIVIVIIVIVLFVIGVRCYQYFHPN